jgi:hypothetical protein
MSQPQVGAGLLGRLGQPPVERRAVQHQSVGAVATQVQRGTTRTIYGRSHNFVEDYATGEIGEIADTRADEAGAMDRPSDLVVFLKLSDTPASAGEG